ncbi:SDR family NAD(P)-dependent oxidoreductase [Isobaculum melis]|uniref:NAD(P)-dependent dehydrogenase, short-chain alcohol dehydrogenase family n=1 Tax=Isobaculum melis TaxID=142588 RepID=A0A1H9R909_9LACT|nr:glucose 1-dehydrogenase [Isobaculum melis]SER69222.1 NAD(P)-dependent dehydrogenase, short-chain alcohol dehydrogenase family [Isobaculum melis]
MKRVEGKVAIITGAGNGMGKESAILLAAEGAKVVATDIQLEAVEAVVKEILANGGDAIAIKHDVANEAEWKQVVAETTAKYGKLDILVNNAGISFDKPFGELTLTDWGRVMQINVDSVFLGTQLAIPEMQKNGGGSIINISSMAAIIGNCGAGPYTASKGAVRSLTKAVAHDYAKDAIRSNSIHPGYIETAMTKELFANPAYKEWFVNNTPLPYLGEGKDIANAVLFLGSDESKFITGVELPIDGGIVAG